MNRSKFTTVQGITIYPIEYLTNKELSDDDLSNLLDNDKRGLRYSLIIGMFKYIGININMKDIIKLVQMNDNWMNEYYWNEIQRNEFEKILTDIFHNIYWYKYEKSKVMAQWYITIYGFVCRNK